MSKLAQPGLGTRSEASWWACQDPGGWVSEYSWDANVSQQNWWRRAWGLLVGLWDPQIESLCALAAVPGGLAALTMPQNEYMNVSSHTGSTMDITSITMRTRREKEGQEAHECSKEAKKMIDLKAKLYHRQLHAEKIHMKKMHEKRNNQTEARWEDSTENSAYITTGQRGTVSSWCTFQHD